jgi:LytS/YehU family sensor histidine kinase
VTPRHKEFLQILAQNCAIALALAVLLWFVNWNTGEGLVKGAAEAFIYVNLISFPAHWILGPRIFPWVARHGFRIQLTVFTMALGLISVAGCAVATLVLMALKMEPGATFPAIFSFTVKLSLFVALLIGITQVTFHRITLQLEDVRLKLRTQELERERALKLASESRLASLEARLHPHFLFNTLNSISSLIPADPERAERLIEKMAALLRFSLEANQGGLIELDQEMQIVRNYLDIEQARLGQRLCYSLDAAIETAQVPPLAVQTLVENSIKHGIAPNRAGGEIRVHAARSDGHLQVDVADNGPGFSASTLPEGHGLDNLRRRLEVLFGDKAELRFARSEGWNIVSVRITASSAQAEWPLRAVEN